MKELNTRFKKGLIAVCIVMASLVAVAAVKFNRYTEGVIEFSNVEGGCYAFVAGDKRYEIVNLSKQFAVHGLKLQVKFKPFDGGTICQIGEAVEATEVRVLK